MAERQFITFRLGKDLYGIDILVVREINHKIDLTNVDRGPEYMRGLQNLRGQIVTIVDTGVKLGLGLRKFGPETSYIVLKTNNELERLGLDTDQNGTCDDLVGLLVDRIGDVISVDDTKIDKATTQHSLGVASEYLEGVVKLDNELLVTLKVANILDTSEKLSTASA